MVRTYVCVTALLTLSLSGCASTHSAGTARDSVAAAPAPRANEQAATLAFVEPAEGSSLLRDQIDARSWSARVVLTAQVERASEVVFFDDAKELATLHAPPWTTSAFLSHDGAHTLRVVAYRDGVELASARRTVTVASLPPDKSGCDAQLGALGIRFVPSRPAKGVTEPVIVEPVIEGVTFVSAHATGGAKPFMVACKMAIRLRELALVLKSIAVEEVRTLGIYNYRPMRNPKCIKAGNCPLSQHAFATALDIHELRGAGSNANVSTDWVINKTSRICPGAPQGDKDALLHKLACALFDQHVFNVILTPNYNERHRDHFHVDLTESWAGIRGEELGLDPAIEGLGD